MNALLYILAALGGAATAVVAYRATGARRRNYHHARQDLIHDAVIAVAEKKNIWGKAYFLTHRDLDTEDVYRRLGIIEVAVEMLNNDKKKGKK